MMRKAVAVFGLVMLCFSHVSAQAERRLAFVVGINTYGNLPADAQLEAAVRDAETVSDTLREIGFQVSTMKSGTTLTNFAKEFAAFTQQIELGDTVLFYYAGHGIAIDNQNYLLPSDIPSLNVGGESVVKRLALAETDLIADIQARGARVTIMVIDACRNNPFPKTATRSLGRARGLSLREPPEGVYSLYSAGAGQEALDRLSETDTSPNSVFTRIFVSELRKPGTNLLDLGETVREEVSLLARTQRHAQVPGVYNQIVGARRIILSNLSAPPAPSVTNAETVAVMPPVANRVPKEDLAPVPEVARSTTSTSEINANLNNQFGAPLPKKTVAVKPDWYKEKDKPSSIPTLQMPAAAVPPVSTGRQSLPAPTAPQMPRLPQVSSAQSAELIEETVGPSNASPSTTSGRVVWREGGSSESVDGKSEASLEAKLDFADAGMNLYIRFEVNHDVSLPASHVISLVFNQNGTAGAERSVQDIGLIQAKTDSNARGSPVSGLPVRVKDNLFVIGLSKLPQDLDKNISLLTDSSWFDLALRYKSGRRAVVTFEKRDMANRLMSTFLSASTTEIVRR